MTFIIILALCAFVVLAYMNTDFSESWSACRYLCFFMSLHVFDDFLRIRFSQVLRAEPLGRPGCPWDGKSPRLAKVSGASDHVPVLVKVARDWRGKVGENDA